MSSYCVRFDRYAFLGTFSNHFGNLTPRATWNLISFFKYFGMVSGLGYLFVGRIKLIGGDFPRIFGESGQRHFTNPTVLHTVSKIPKQPCARDDDDYLDNVTHDDSACIGDEIVYSGSEQFVQLEISE